MTKDELKEKKAKYFADAATALYQDAFQTGYEKAVENACELVKDLLNHIHINYDGAEIVTTGEFNENLFRKRLMEG